MLESADSQEKLIRGAQSIFSVLAWAWRQEKPESKVWSSRGRKWTPEQLVKDKNRWRRRSKAGEYKASQVEADSTKSGVPWKSTLEAFGAQGLSPQVWKQTHGGQCNSHASSSPGNLENECNRRSQKILRGREVDPSNATPTLLRQDVWPSRSTSALTLKKKLAPWWWASTDSIGYTACQQTFWS